MIPKLKSRAQMRDNQNPNVEELEEKPQNNNTQQNSTQNTQAGSNTPKKKGKRNKRGKR